MTKLARNPIAIAIWLAAIFALAAAAVATDNGLYVVAALMVIPFGAMFLLLPAPRLPLGTRKCQGCDKQIDERLFALTYGEDEGLCRPCLDEFLPLALKASQEKEGQS